MGNPVYFIVWQKTGPVHLTSRADQSDSDSISGKKSDEPVFYDYRCTRGGKDGDADKYSNGNASKTRLACD